MRDKKGACSTIGGRLCVQEVSNELDKLARIYDLFKEQKDFQVGSQTRGAGLESPLHMCASDQPPDCLVGRSLVRLYDAIAWRLCLTGGDVCDAVE